MGAAMERSGRTEIILLSTGHKIRDLGSATESRTYNVCVILTIICSLARIDKGGENKIATLSHVSLSLVIIACELL